MARRSTDWHISGWAAILLAPLILPVAILIQLLPIKKTRDRNAQEVAGFIADFLDGTGGDWDWDDFTSVPITSPLLNDIRDQADAVPLPLTPEGKMVLQALLAKARGLAGEANSATN